MNTKKQRELASRMLGVGKDKIVLDPKKADSIEDALTRADIRNLIQSKAIMISKAPHHSRGRARILADQKRKGRKSGTGKKKGTKGAKMPRKKAWMMRIRALRSEIAELREKNSIDKKERSSFYKLAKSGVLRSRAHLRLLLKKSRV